MKITAILTIALALVCAGAPLFGASKGRSFERRKAEALAAGNPEFDNYVSMKSGDWDDDIWALRRAYYDDEIKAPQKGKRPQKDATMEIRWATVTLSTPAEVLSFYLSRTKSQLVIARGGVLKVNTRYEGQGGSEGTGTVSLERGGKLYVDTRFILAGKLAQHQNVVGVFNHNGGDATLSVPLHLTGHFTLTSSATATGVYNLNDGTLNIVQANPDKVYGGIDTGIGTGHFNFNGGTLNADTVGIDLENVKSGNLSPAGDGEIGKTVFFGDKANAQYTQAGAARLTIDIGGRAKYDKLVWKTKQKGGKVVFRDGAQIFVQYVKNYRASTGATFDIVEADHIELQGKLTLKGPAGDDFSYELVQGRQGDILRLKYGR